MLCLVATPARAAGPAVTFDPAVNYDTGTEPRSVTTGDFNGDGKTDLVTANYDSDHISVLLGNGDGTFATKLDYPVGPNPVSVTTADFNGDGKADLVTADAGGNDVSVLLGVGDGTFPSKAVYTVGMTPSQVITGDFNRDGKADLAISNQGGSSISVLLGNGDGTFAAKVDYTVGNTPYSVASGDYNGDGKIDLATANFYSNVSVLLGNGDGTFAAKVDYDAGSNPSYVTTGDFNRDGKADLAVANYYSENISVLLGNGDGTFAAKVDYGTESGPSSVMAADFNADGMTDLAVQRTTGYSAPGVTVLLGNGDGTFATKVGYEMGLSPPSLATDDFNHDGKADLATANGLSDSVSVLINTTAIEPAGGFSQKVDYGAGNSPRSVITDDFNADGKADLATVNGSSNDISILLGNGDGTFATKVDYAAGLEPWSITSGDFNRDGKVDLAAANNIGYDVSVLLGNGDGTFAAKVDYMAGIRPYSVTAADFNHDGKVDLATANWGSEDVSILIGNGDGTFAAAAYYAVGSQPYSVTTGDFNRDGKSDVAVANAGSDNVSILLNNGDGTFAAKVDYYSGGWPFRITTGDFNGDGKIDLATANWDTTVFILLGNGDGSFTAAGYYSVGDSSPSSVNVGDFNRDGKFDLATANPERDNTSIFMGNGDGTFASKVDYSAGDAPYLLTGGDFNRDGKADLAIANSNSDSVSLLLNRGFDYCWTWYDDVGGDNWVLMANPASATHDLIFSLTVGGDPMDLSGYGEGIVAPGASITPKYGIKGGSVEATSVFATPGLVSQRTLWPKGGSSLEEVPGTEFTSLSSHYYWTWYDQLSSGFTNWILIANPSDVETVRAQVFIGGAVMHDPANPGNDYFDIAPGDNVTPMFPGTLGGPVEVRAYTPGGAFTNEADRRNVIASQRVLTGGGIAFNEVPGIAEEELSDDYLWTWYDSTRGAANWILIANPPTKDDGVTPSDPIYYKIKIGETEKVACSASSIPAGGNVTPIYYGDIGGPVEVSTWSDATCNTTPARSITSQRSLWGPSFEEVPGYPYLELAAVYHWTWYDENEGPGVQNWVLVANPSTSSTIYYRVFIGGAPANSCTSIAPLANSTPRFPGIRGGPVEVKAYTDAGCTTPASGGVLFASQRVLWNGFFNEVLGTVLD